MPAEEQLHYEVVLRQEQGGGFGDDSGYECTMTRHHLGFSLGWKPGISWGSEVVASSARR